MQNEGFSSEVNQFSEAGTVRSSFCFLTHEIRLTSNFQNSIQSILYTCIVRLYDNLSMDIWRTSTLEHICIKPCVRHCRCDLTERLETCSYRVQPGRFSIKRYICPKLNGIKFMVVKPRRACQTSSILAAQECFNNANES